MKSVISEKNNYFAISLGKKEHTVEQEFERLKKTIVPLYLMRD